MEDFQVIRKLGQGGQGTTLQVCPSHLDGIHAVLNTVQIIIALYSSQQTPVDCMHTHIHTCTYMHTYVSIYVVT